MQTIKVIIAILLMTGFCWADKQKCVCPHEEGGDCGCSEWESYLSKGVTKIGNLTLTTIQYPYPLTPIQIRANDGYLIINSDSIHKDTDFKDVKYHFSCPEGYELTAKIKNRNYDKECQGYHPDVICFHNTKYTDATLQCVKDN